MNAAVRHVLRDPTRLWGRVWPVAGLSVVLAGHLIAAEPAAARRYRADSSVVHAAGKNVQPGGKTGEAEACSYCHRSACPQCRAATGQNQRHRPCQHGLCPAHCPVRPEVFGFYGTRWRKWPGTGVVQTSNNEAAVPVRPPRAEVPGVREESPEPDSTAEDLPAPDAREVLDELKAPAAAPGGQGAEATQPEKTDALATGHKASLGRLAPTVGVTQTKVLRVALQPFAATDLTAAE